MNRPQLGRCSRRVLVATLALAAATGMTGTSHADDVVDDHAIHAAVARSLPLIETGGRVSMQERKRCFTCHNQGLPLAALATAREHGFEVNAEHFQTQLQFTADFLAKNRVNYLAGKGQGGQVITAGYALWTLDAGGWQPDDTTAAVVEYLLTYQSDLPYWKAPSNRPPSEASLFTTSFVALNGLRAFGTPAQQTRITRRVAQVRKWILETSAKDTEDRVFRLWALAVTETPSGELEQAAQALLATQRDDGGWAQLDNLSSDAYATGTALVALHRAGNVATNATPYRRGIAWLVRSQLADGSWHVATRSKPIQTYYESGYPHGEDQFISITAAGWSTIALADALPKAKADDARK